eukprot:scaffold129747_cov18-Tisochrysis_lutea.AAC.1
MVDPLTRTGGWAAFVPCMSSAVQACCSSKHFLDTGKMFVVSKGPRCWPRWRQAHSYGWQHRHPPDSSLCRTCTPTCSAGPPLPLRRCWCLFHKAYSAACKTCVHLWGSQWPPTCCTWPCRWASSSRSACPKLSSHNLQACFQHADLSLTVLLGFTFQGSMHLRMGLPGAALSISLAEWAAALTYLALGWSKRSQLGLDLGWTREVRGAISSSSSSSSPGSGWRPRADSAGDEGWRMEDNGVPTGGAVDGMGASSSQPQSSSSSSITNTTPATINSNGNGKYEAGGKGAPALPVVGNLKSSTATGGSPNSDSSVASTNGRRAALSESTATPSGANGSASADSVDGRVASTSGRPALLEPPTTASTVRQGQAPVGATLRAFFASYAPFLQERECAILPDPQYPPCCTPGH